VPRAVQAGVRSIEHGNLVDEATVREMKRHGTFFVPTLATYEALAAEGERLGWSAAMLAKLKNVQDQGIAAVRLAQSEGVPIVFGTDLLGHMHARQNREFLLRAPALTPVQVLQSATITAARLLRQEAHVGQLVPGAFADLLVVDGEPTEDAGVMADPARHIRLLMQGGRVLLNRSNGP
jgi:imidazolonepropionase-like amidohydrolase